MPEKPANEDLSEQVTGMYNNAAMESIYELSMDTLLAQMGRTVKFYLEPSRTPTVTNPEHYDPFSRGQDRRQGSPDTGNKGYTVEPIWVNYKAHVVHGPKEVKDDETGVQFQLEIGDVQLTTVYGALADINEAIELEVDGIKFLKKEMDPRPIGLSTPKYVISIWTKKTDKA